MARQKKPRIEALEPVTEPEPEPISVPASMPVADYDNVVMFISGQGHASCYEMMTEFGIGYSQAVRFMDQLEEDGLVGPAPADAGPRELV